MRASAPGRTAAALPAVPPLREGVRLTRLVTRFVIAQAVAVAAVGLPFSRRHLPSILITLAMMAAVCLLALMVRSGARAAWLAAVGFEAVFFLYGLARFVTARYVGGTFFALIISGALLHPAVARAYGVTWGKAAHPAETELGEAAGETLGGHSIG